MSNNSKSPRLMKTLIASDWKYLDTIFDLIEKDILNLRIDADSESVHKSLTKNLNQLQRIRKELRL